MMSKKQQALKSPVSQFRTFFSKQSKPSSIIKESSLKNDQILKDTQKKMRQLNNSNKMFIQEEKKKYDMGQRNIHGIDLDSNSPSVDFMQRSIEK